MQEELRSQALKLFSGFPYAANADAASASSAEADKPKPKAAKPGAARKPRNRK
jgi:hypothetical protein